MIFKYFRGKKIHNFLSVLKHCIHKKSIPNAIIARHNKMTLNFFHVKRNGNKIIFKIPVYT